MITVAVVEDDDKEAERIKSYLVSYGKENDENFNVLHFSDGLEFLEKIRPEIDVVFMDIEMPFLNGMDAAKKLRQSDPSVRPPCFHNQFKTVCPEWLRGGGHGLFGKTSRICGFFDHDGARVRSPCFVHR